MKNALRRIYELGQSIWYDNLSREILKSGKLKQIIQEDGITGVTSNPSIFQKALSDERIYDNDLHNLVDSGCDSKQIYESLIIEDVRQAADLLASVYRETHGQDGFVSLEVAPSLAYERNPTIAEGKRLFEMVDRPNLMIKVPGTVEGCEAAKELLGAGINVNITLLFSIEQYKAAVEAYLKGMEELITAGGDPSKTASVTSFFVSRVDTLVDERIRESSDPILKTQAPGLLGKAAIANAVIAYDIFEKIFNGEEFRGLKAKGVRPQKIVLASTSTKNPDYPDTYYVDKLLWPGTINTIPVVTLEAYRDHGNPEIADDRDVEKAKSLLQILESHGLNIEQIMERLLEDGINQFASSFDDLIDGIEQKRTRLLRGWGHRSASLGALHSQVESVLESFNQDKLGESIWAGNTHIWTSNPNHGINQRLGWLNSVDLMCGETNKLWDFSQEVLLDGIQDVALLGMGGSSLAAEVLSKCFGSAEGYPKMWILDTTVPTTIMEFQESVNLEHTLFIVASKSGGTIEVMSLFKYFKSEVEKAGLDVGKRFVAITDPGTSLGKLAAENGFRKIFLNPSDIGGRFSALSYFGLAPAALLGIDLDRFLMRAAQSVEACGPDVPALENPGTWMGSIAGVAANQGLGKLTIVISPPIGSFGLWLEQLIAESTGKLDTGVLPVIGEDVGAPDTYGPDRVFVYLRLDGDTTYDQQISDLEKAGRPVVTQRIHNPYDLGREMFRWEFATAVIGVILKINPFDQPNVQESKDITRKSLELYESEGHLPVGARIPAHDTSMPKLLADFLESVRQGDYVGINAFISESPTAVSHLQSMRIKLRDKFKIATTLGFGPRYLHSTGQIQKGGKANGHFIQITMDDERDIDIPGEKFSFGILKAAQSIGDYEALKKKGRPVMNIHLRDESDLKLISAAMDKI